MVSNQIILDSSGQEWQVIGDDGDTLEELNFKIIIIGNAFVGKSSIAERAVQNSFKQKYNSTVGFEFLSYNLLHNKTIVKLQLWDTCGQEVYRSLITNFYKNAALAIIVYSIDNRESFEKVDGWLKQLKLYASLDTQVLLVGNKIDIEERKVTKEEGEEFTKKNLLNYFIESSAKTGENVHNIFVEAAKGLYDNHLKYEGLDKEKKKNLNDINDAFDSTIHYSLFSNKTVERRRNNCNC